MPRAGRPSPRAARRRVPCARHRALPRPAPHSRRSRWQSPSRRRSTGGSRAVPRSAAWRAIAHRRRGRSRRRRQVLRRDRRARAWDRRSKLRRIDCIVPARHPCETRGCPVHVEVYMKLTRLLSRTLLTGLVAATAAGAALAQDIKFFRIGTGGTAGTYYPIGGLHRQRDLQSAGLARLHRRRQLRRAGRRGDGGGVQRVGRQHQRHPVGPARIGLHAIRRRVLGLHRHRRVRRQAQGRRPAPHRQPLSGDDPPRRAQGRQHQERGRPQGQARVARRAGLGHAGRRAHHPGRLRPHREGHHAPST